MNNVAIGGMLAEWRRGRRISQLDLALEAGVSARHVSFVETGRSRPSRDMVLTLCGALGVPPRERNGFLLAAGFAPLYRETPIEDPQMAPAVAALVLMLRRNEPFGAVVLDRNWDMVMMNDAYGRLLRRVLPPDAEPPRPFELTPAPRINLLRLLFRPDGWRNHILNWRPVAAAILGRVRREITRDGDAGRRALLAEIEACPGLPPVDAEPGISDLVIPVELREGEGTLRLLSTIAILGTAQDLTLQDLRIETFHPADEETERLVRAGAAAGS